MATTDIKNPPLPDKPRFGQMATANGKKVQCQLMWELGAYKVISITNTTVAKPGDRLDEKWVSTVCNEYGNWEVTMVDNDIAAKIFGFVRGMIPFP